MTNRPRSAPLHHRRLRASLRRPLHLAVAVVVVALLGVLHSASTVDGSRATGDAATHAPDVVSPYGHQPTNAVRTAGPIVTRIPGRLAQQRACPLGAAVTTPGSTIQHCGPAVTEAQRSSAPDRIDRGAVGLRAPPEHPSP